MCVVYTYHGRSDIDIDNNISNFDMEYGYRMWITNIDIEIDIDIDIDIDILNIDIDIYFDIDIEEAIVYCVLSAGGLIDLVYAPPWILVVGQSSLAEQPIKSVPKKRTNKGSQSSFVPKKGLNPAYVEKIPKLNENVHYINSLVYIYPLCRAS